LRKSLSLKKQLLIFWTLSKVPFFFVFKQLFGDCTPSGKRPTQLDPIDEEKSAFWEVILSVILSKKCICICVSFRTVSEIELLHRISTFPPGRLCIIHGHRY
jgi:hypothetical protein